MAAEPIPGTDVVTYKGSDQRQREAELVVAVGPDGQPTGAVKITPRHVVVLNGKTVSGSKPVLDQDINRTGLTIRNDSEAQMYFNLGAEADPDHGYPLDAKRGYSFEALGMLPMDQLHLWCNSADQKYVILVATKTTAEEGDA